MIGQNPNIIKSKIFFPDWFNLRVANSICHILNFKRSDFPFTYLGVLVSPKKLAISHFDNMIKKINKAASGWNNAKISIAGEIILINSSLMAIQSYYLAVYQVSGSSLDKISRSAKKLLWASSNNSSGMPMVSWNNTILDQSNGALGLQNLRLAKQSLMARNVFILLNKMI